MVSMGGLLVRSTLSTVPETSVPIATLLPLASLAVTLQRVVPVRLLGAVVAAAVPHEVLLPGIDRKAAANRPARRSNP